MSIPLEWQLKLIEEIPCTGEWTKIQVPNSEQWVQMLWEKHVPEPGERDVGSCVYAMLTRDGRLTVTTKATL